MGIEQNLDEMLRSLQQSVDDLSESEDIKDEGSEDYKDISTSDLQRILEEKYSSDRVTGSHESDSNYSLDDDVLAEFFGNGETEEEETFLELPEEATSVSNENDIVESTSTEINELFEQISSYEEEDLSDNVEAELDTETSDALDVLEESEMYADEEQTESIERFEQLEDFEPVGNTEISDDLDVIEFSEKTDETEEYDEAVSDFEEFDVIDTHTLIDVDPSEVILTEDEADTDNSTESDTEADAEEDTEAVYGIDGDNEDAVADSFDPYGSVPEERRKSFKSIIMDYGRPDPVPSLQDEELEAELQDDESDFETPDVGDILSDFADDSPTREDKMNSAVHKFMSSLGCVDELSDVSAEDIGAIYGQFVEEQPQENGAATEERITEKQGEYKKTTLISALKLSVCVLMTFIMFLYDVLPIFEVDFIGLSDYVLYPGAYVMIGTQLLLICAAFMWRDLWKGIKGLLTVYPGIYSMAAVIVCACVSYDFVFFITGSYKPLETPMFHFLCGAFLTVVSLYSLLMNMREAATYNMYSADVAKFTLTRDKGANSIGEKMYSGGFTKDKRVYSPSAVIDPKGFFKAISEDGSFYNVVFSSLILMSVGIGVIFGIILLIVGRTIEEGSIAAMSAVMALTPISAVAAILIPAMISYLFLKKRGIALTGRKMIKKYGAQNAIVFSDLHLFSKCDPKRIGFECYEKLQTKNVLAALNILYSRIGGPMGEVFSNIPEEYRAKTVRVRRITKSGIEAVVDKSHVLLVGDTEFMRRYGIEFPAAVSKDNGDTILVSLDGRATARLLAVYEIEPVFDMLIERLAAEGVHCVIETYDPMISTAFVTRHRRKGRAPISVVHKNAADINRTQNNANKRSDHGLLVLSSRLKLAEAVVWCSRLCKAEKLLNLAVYVSVGVVFIITAALGAFGLVPCFIQYLLFAYMLLIAILMVVLTFKKIPQKGYFTVGALADEDDIREINERKKDTNEQKRK